MAILEPKPAYGLLEYSGRLYEGFLRNRAIFPLWKRYATNLQMRL